MATAPTPELPLQTTCCSWAKHNQGLGAGVFGTLGQQAAHLLLLISALGGTCISGLPGTPSGWGKGQRPLLVQAKFPVQPPLQGAISDSS